MTKQRVSTNLHPVDFERLCAMADKMGISIADLVRLAITNTLHCSIWPSDCKLLAQIEDRWGAMSIKAVVPQEDVDWPIEKLKKAWQVW